VTNRSWAEDEVAGTLAGGLLGVASLSDHRPEVAADLRAAVLAKIGVRERVLIRQLAEEIGPTD
jgi:hypothetical protein